MVQCKKARHYVELPVQRRVMRKDIGAVQPDAVLTTVRLTELLQ